MNSQDLWKRPVEEVFAELKTSGEGLTTKEVNERLIQFGPNVIQEKDKKTAVDLAISQFTNPLVIILIVASIISGYLGDVFDTVIILTVVVLSAAFGFIQEYKSEKVLSELKKYFSHYAIALRDGQKVQIDSKLLIPGDIIYVRLGDILPADVRIIETEGIFVDESILTGESANVEKKPSEITSAATPQDITNGLFMGTTVTEGYAKVLVIDTGERTFFGKTAAVFSSKIPESDFQLGIRKFGNLLIRVIVIITTVIFIVNYAQNHGEKDPLVDSALFALAIAIGIAPEALPAVITITLSNGSLALAKKKVVTKKLAAIEDLGNMDVLCTDKTGTLTEELKVEKYVDLDKHDNRDILEYAVLCNAAVGTTHFRGNSVDVAIKRHAKKNGVDISRFTKLEEIPFDFTRRRMGQIVKEGKKTLLIVKGSTESLLTVCSQIQMDTKSYPIKEKIDEIKEISKEYGLSGYTTIGIAAKEIKPKKSYSKEDEIELTFLGFLLLGNPPKQSVRHTLDRLKKLNVKLKILTGDDQLVTKHLCESIGFIPSENKIMTGTELGNIDDTKISEIVE
ncbi:MAG: HAD-IC family P-type ATPase, partial [Candidatus Micrarchaeota archaeon]|nr:HAD-IC family P-type ATPase [Candidatus Micrarchaeota archaeon]